MQVYYICDPAAMWFDTGDSLMLAIDTILIPTCIVYADYVVIHLALAENLGTHSNLWFLVLLF